jgi:hypothetical protein
LPPDLGHPELHRHQALKRAAQETHHHGREGNFTESPSAGDAPRAPVALDLDPPASTRWMRRVDAAA